MARFTSLESPRETGVRNQSPPTSPSQVELQQGLADLEFQVDVAQEPVSRLGFDAKKARPVFNPIGDDVGPIAGIYTGPQAGFEEGDSLPKRNFVQEQSEANIRIGDVVVTRDFLDDREVWSHEFRHRGLNRLREKFNQEQFSERYGTEAAQFLFNEAEEDLVDFMGEHSEGTEHTGHNLGERGHRISEALTEAALDVLEDERTTSPEDRQQAMSWIRRMFGRR